MNSHNLNPLDLSGFHLSVEQLFSQERINRESLKEYDSNRAKLEKDFVEITKEIFELTNLSVFLMTVIDGLNEAPNDPVQWMRSRELKIGQAFSLRALENEVQTVGLDTLKERFSEARLYLTRMKSLCESLRKQANDAKN